MTQETNEFLDDILNEKIEQIVHKLPELKELLQFTLKTSLEDINYLSEDLIEFTDTNIRIFNQF